MECLQIESESILLIICLFFSVVNDIQSSPATLRNDVKVISNWAFQWKMVFNFDLIKQAHQVNLVEPALPVSFV